MTPMLPKDVGAGVGEGEVVDERLRDGATDTAGGGGARLVGGGRDVWLPE